MPEKPAAILFLGKSYPARADKSKLLRKHGFCELVGDEFQIHIPAHLTPTKERTAIQHAIVVWYQARAAEIFLARVKIYVPQIGVTVKSIKLADPKSRWGSCGKDGRLMFSWRAVMLPLELLDYLVVHELCHLVHFDHSKAYWKTVETILPDYKILRAEMRRAEQTIHRAV